MTLTSQNIVTWHDRNTTQPQALLNEWAGNGLRTLSPTTTGPAPMRSKETRCK